MDHFLELTPIAQDLTLMKPTGGPAERYDDREKEIRASADYFNGGEARLESVETHVWGDTVVIAMVERQHGKVGGLPEQDWSLRVTHVYRHDGSDWLLVLLQKLHKLYKRIRSSVPWTWSGCPRSPAAERYSRRASWLASRSYSARPSSEPNRYGSVTT